MEFLSNFFGIVILLLLAAAVLGALVGIAWLWVRFRGWMFLIFGVTFVSFASSPSPSVSALLLIALFAMFVSGALAGLALVVGDVQNFGEKLTEKKSSDLHEHGDLGWHDHPHERNHAHYGNHLSGPFYYVDERVIDQR